MNTNNDIGIDGNQSGKRTLVMTGGGTAGHVIPNLALLPHLKARFDEIIYIGESGGTEERLARDAGLSFRATECVKFSRSLSLKTFAVPIKLVKAVKAAKKLLGEIRPDAIISKGGYVALPVVLAADKSVPIFLHESDLSFGLANRLSLRKAKTVFTSFPETASGLDKAVCVGAPIRQSVYLGDRERAKAECGLTANLPYLLIVGGSSGAAALNDAVWDAVEKLTARYNVIHLTGKGKSRLIKKSNYYQADYTDGINDYFALADLVVTRGGSGALFELMALKKPALCVPLPKGASRGDQVLNAEYFEKKGCLKVLPQDALCGETLFLAVEDLRKHASELKSNASKLENIDGTRKIAAIIADQTRVGTARHPSGDL